MTGRLYEIGKAISGSSGHEGVWALLVVGSIVLIASFLWAVVYLAVKFGQLYGIGVLCLAAFICYFIAGGMAKLHNAKKQSS